MMPLLSAAKKDQEKDAAYVAFCANLAGRENLPTKKCAAMVATKIKSITKPQTTHIRGISQLTMPPSAGPL